MGRNIQNNYIGSYFQISENVRQQTFCKYKRYSFSDEKEKPCFLDKSIFEKDFPKQILQAKAEEVNDFLNNKQLLETDIQASIERILFFHIQNCVDEYLFEQNIFIPDVISIDFDFTKIMYYEGDTQILQIDADFITNSINELKEKYKFFIDFMNEKFGENAVEIRFGVVYYRDEIA